MMQTTRRSTGRGAPLNQTTEMPAYAGQPADAAETIEEIWDRANARGGALRALAEVVVMAAIMYGVYTFLLTGATIAGTTMAPTLRDGQQLLVSRSTYLLSPPQRGDIVVLRDPLGSGRIVARRVIGLPGEKVEVRGRQVIVNNRPLNEPYASAPILAGDSMTSVVALELGDDELYALADNRLSLNDSRTWGPVKLDAVVGRAWLVYWPPDSIGIVTHHRYEQETLP